MNRQKNFFNSLSPIILENEKERSIYNEALNYALNNQDINNIAITGIYGSGKSTIWNTYVYKNKLDKIITVSLAKYDRLNNSNKDNLDNSINNENRIENQIMNQILSQINMKQIPLSKYVFKRNRSLINTIVNSFLILSMFISALIFILLNFVSVKLKTLFGDFENKYFYLVILLLFFIPLIYFLVIFINKNKFKIWKLNFKFAEAKSNDSNFDDETVFDRNIKELAYLLISSKSKIVVFEDLDRYDNVYIYSKLRELNFLINQNIKKHKKSKKIKFIYILKDDLFNPNDKVKFFDFIIPVFPLINSKTSSSELFSLLNKADSYFENNNKAIEIISSYVEDMRLIKNIVNEYIIYLNSFLDKVDESNKDKILSLIAFKNLFPKEFNNLWKNEGFLFELFKKIENQKEEDINKLKTEIHEFNNKEIENKINKIINLSYSEYLSEQINNQIVIFEPKNQKEKFIKALVAEGLLDNNFWYYLPNFSIDNLEDCSLEDKKYLNYLTYETEEILDPFMKLENVKRILSFLDSNENLYKSKDVLNKSVLEECLIEKKDQSLKLILNNVEKYQNYEKLINIMEQLNYTDLNYLLNFLVKIQFINKEEIFEKILMSNIENEDKMKCLKFSEAKISNLFSLSKDSVSSEVFDFLLEYNKIEFNLNNLKYISSKTINKNTFKYINSNFSEKTKHYFENRDLIPFDYKLLVRGGNLDNDIYDSLIKIVKDNRGRPIKHLTNQINKEQIKKLIQENWIADTKQNRSIFKEVCPEFLSYFN